MSWPLPRFPGDVIDVGSGQATEMLEEVPASERLYTLSEVVQMMDALGELPESSVEWTQWCEDHVEHMAAGGYVIGRPIGS
jgi:hypothetical protein